MRLLNCVFCFLIFSFVSLNANVFPPFNPDTVTEIKGKVLSIQRFHLITEPTASVQIFVKTDEGNLPVVLGPEWYLKLQGLNFAPMNPVEIKGSLVKTDHHMMMIASSVKKGRITLRFRDEDGKPLWTTFRR